MCLEVLVQIPEGAPGRISAKRLGVLSGLVVTPGRLDDQAALHLSVSGGCSCEFLAKGSSDQSDVWELDPVNIPRLSVALQALNSEVRKYRLVAHWLGGDTQRTEARISGRDLLQLVESSKLGNNVVYRTWSGT